MSPWEVSTEGVSADGSVLIPEGVYHAEVASVDTAPTKAGERMLTLRLRRVSDETPIVTERLTFGDKARGLSIAKLYALGVERPADGKPLSFEPADLVRRRVAVLIVHEKRTDQNGNERTEARVAAFQRSRAPFGICGYCAEKEALELGVIGEAAPVKEETPF